jgi:hypothetical protein
MDRGRTHERRSRQPSSCRTGTPRDRRCDCGRHTATTAGRWRPTAGTADIDADSQIAGLIAAPGQTRLAASAASRGRARIRQRDWAEGRREYPAFAPASYTYPARVTQRIAPAVSHYGRQRWRWCGAGAATSRETDGLSAPRPFNRTVASDWFAGHGIDDAAGNKSARRRRQRCGGTCADTHVTAQRLVPESRRAFPCAHVRPVDARSGGAACVVRECDLNRATSGGGKSMLSAHQVICPSNRGPDVVRPRGPTSPARSREAERHNDVKRLRHTTDCACLRSPAARP